MEKIQLPEITTEIQAEPWAEGHVAHFITTRAVSQKSKPKRVITANILNIFVNGKMLSLPIVT